MLALPVLLGIFPRSRWSPPFPLHDSLSPRCGSRSILNLSSLMIWYSGQTALFLFLLARAAPAFLPTALSVALRPLFPFRHAQYFQVFPLKPAPFCTLFADLGSTNKSAIFLLFSYYLTLVLSSPPSFLLSQALWQIWQELSFLSFCPIRLIWVPGHSFLPGTTRLTSLPDGERYLRPPQSLVVSLVFFRTGGVLSFPNILTHRFPRFPLRNLCSLCPFSSSLQWTQPSFRLLPL